MKKFLLATAFLSLTACAYTLDEAHQDVHVVTPGAKDSLCYLYVDKLRYRVRPPQTLSIPKSDENLIVDCLAPGNRRQEVVFEPAISQSLILNAANGFVPGLAFDMASNAMYRYPEIVEVNFAGAKVKPIELPAQNNPDIKQPEEYNLEEFLPGDPRLNSDRNRIEMDIQRRQRPGDYSDSAYTDDVLPGDAGENLHGKSNLDSIFDSLGAGANPAIEPSAGAAIPLYPGD